MAEPQEFGPGIAVLLGVVEGLTEFLPVSSTGHLIIVGHLLGFTGAVADSVEVSIQLGSILAVVAYERRKIAVLLSQAGRELGTWLTARRRDATLHARTFPGQAAATCTSLGFLSGLGAAFLPAAVIGFFQHDWIEAHLFSPITVALGLLVGGAIILWVEASRRQARIIQLEQVRVP